MALLAEANRSLPQPMELLATSVAVTARTSTAQITTLLDQIQSLTRDAEALTEGRSQAELTTRLEATSWSVAECFDHLAQTTNAFLPAICEAMAGSPKLTTKRRLRTGTLAQLFIRNLEPPYRIRFKVLAPLVPQHQDFELAWMCFLESQTKLAETVRCAAGLAIDQVRIKSPVYGRISYNVYGALRILAAHERRHLWQIEQIFKALDSRAISKSIPKYDA